MPITAIATALRRASRIAIACLAIAAGIAEETITYRDGDKFVSSRVVFAGGGKTTTIDIEERFHAGDPVWTGDPEDFGDESGRFWQATWDRYARLDHVVTRADDDSTVSDHRTETWDGPDGRTESHTYRCRRLDQGHRVLFLRNASASVSSRGAGRVVIRQSMRSDLITGSLREGDHLAPERPLKSSVSWYMDQVDAPPFMPAAMAYQRRSLYLDGRLSTFSVQSQVDQVETSLTGDLHAGVYSVDGVPADLQAVTARILSATANETYIMPYGMWSTRWLPTDIDVFTWAWEPSSIQ